MHTTSISETTSALAGSTVTPIDCGEEGFYCPGGYCIASVWVCDGYDDCLDLADETNCPGKHNVLCVCPIGYYKPAIYWKGCSQQKMQPETTSRVPQQSLCIEIFKV